jgi:hypothetical protein
MCATGTRVALLWLAKRVTAIDLMPPGHGIRRSAICSADMARNVRDEHCDRLDGDRSRATLSRVARLQLDLGRTGSQMFHPAAKCLDTTGSEPDGPREAPLWARDVSLRRLRRRYGRVMSRPDA